MDSDNNISLISSDEQKAQIQTAREHAAEERKRKREANKKATANKPPKHSIKVQQARMRLPQLTEQAEKLLELVKTSGATLNEIEVLASHLQHYVREEKTAMSRNMAGNFPFNTGDMVQIVSASQQRDQQYIGKTGKITGIQNIHVLVETDDNKTLYLYLSDVTDIEFDAELASEQAS